MKLISKESSELHISKDTSELLELLRIAGLPITPTELLRIARMPEATRLSGASEDTLRRRYGHLLVKIAPSCTGMRVIHALQLSTMSK